MPQDCKIDTRDFDGGVEDGVRSAKRSLSWRDICLKAIWRVRCTMTENSSVVFAILGWLLFACSRFDTVVKCKVRRPARMSVTYLRCDASSDFKAMISERERQNEAFDDVRM